MVPLATIRAFDAWLSERSLRFEAVVVGGSALALLGVTDRQTRDLDVLHPALSETVVRAAREFAAHVRGDGVQLADDWVNNGPMDLGKVLPEGWLERVQPIFNGIALTLTTLGREDLLKSKLFALCDRGTDLGDCLALAPTRDELTAAAIWLVHQDANPMWPEHVRETLADLSRRLGHGV
ncbi:MAG: hypothetical protein KJ042_10645 [Deltaproteobacteria bacterium]|nr:hypothetical protein [Deltaproteobacteria bacterium]